MWSSGQQERGALKMGWGSEKGKAKNDKQKGQAGIGEDKEGGTLQERD